RTPIPVAGVPEIAFLAVQIRVNPGAGGILDLLRDFVRSRPVALCVVPERPEQRCHLRDRPGCQRLPEFVQCHGLMVPESKAADTRPKVVTRYRFSCATCARKRFSAVSTKARKPWGSTNGFGPSGCARSCSAFFTPSKYDGCAPRKMSTGI